MIFVYFTQTKRCTVLCETHISISTLCLNPRDLTDLLSSRSLLLDCITQLRVSPGNDVFFISLSPVVLLAWQSLTSVRNLFLCDSLLVKPFFT